MIEPLPEVLIRAEHLLTSGRREAAAALLRPALAQVHPDVVPAAAVGAAVLYAHTLAGAGHPAAAVDWAGWAHVRSRHRHGQDHLTTVRALRVHASALLTTGRARLSAAGYRGLITTLTTPVGPGHQHTLAARADLAVALHRAEVCATAHAELTDAWHTRRAHTDNTDDTDELAVRMLTRLAGMYRDCANPYRATGCYRRALHRAHHSLRQQVHEAPPASRRAPPTRASAPTTRMPGRHRRTRPRPTDRALHPGTDPMPYPRKYPQNLIDAAVARVQQQRAAGDHRAVTAVAQELNLQRRLVQKWVIDSRPATTTSPAVQQGPADQRADDTDPREVVLPPGLLWCRLCDQPMTAILGCDEDLVYDCPPGSFRPALPAARVVDAIGRAVLRHAPRIVPTALAHPHSPQMAAACAGRVISRVTAGRAPTDLRITWRPVITSLVPFTDYVELARTLAGSNPAHARELLHAALAAVDPATAPADPLHADAAGTLAEVLIRLGHPSAAIRWATYAHHAHTHLRGPAAATTLTALHTLATAHRLVGHHQRAYHHYRHLAEQLATTAGPEAHHTLAAQASLAVVLHQLGHCAHARTLLADTITAHRRAHPGHPATDQMTGHLARMWQHCAEQRHQHPDAG
ncbi:tetratricopeptide repeat protein [Micromonospora sp. NPDC047548]|uniref:tetratricopeptide repeat protein n=1 Tax=Micromonospora sp. NPDC047548 TaxID=3155624 RepID=UPI0033F7E40B